MSRIANQPVVLPKGVEIKQSAGDLVVKGPKGELSMAVNSEISINVEEGRLTFAAKSGSRFAHAMSGTTRALVSNMVTGVSDGFERKLELVGVGYRAKAQGKKLNLTLGFSHPVNHDVPEGITIETPSQTEILVKGIDKQKVGQVAADIRRYRPPEPYKGKGVRYSDEHVVRKRSEEKIKVGACSPDRLAGSQDEWIRNKTDYAGPARHGQRYGSLKFLVFRCTAPPSIFMLRLSGLTVAPCW